MNDNDNDDIDDDVETKSSLISSFLTLDYKSRREIATKALGSKLLEGYTLKNMPCDECGMPVMEKENIVQCAICPFLAKKAQEQEERKGRKQLGKGDEDVDVNDDDCNEDIITKSMLINLKKQQIIKPSSLVSLSYSKQPQK